MRGNGLDQLLQTDILRGQHEHAARLETVGGGMQEIAHAATYRHQPGMRMRRYRHADASAGTQFTNQIAEKNRYGAIGFRRAGNDAGQAQGATVEPATAAVIIEQDFPYHLVRAITQGGGGQGVVGNEFTLGFAGYEVVDAMNGEVCRTRRWNWRRPFCRRFPAL